MYKLYHNLVKIKSMKAKIKLKYKVDLMIRLNMFKRYLQSCIYFKTIMIKLWRNL